MTTTDDLRAIPEAPSDDEVLHYAAVQVESLGRERQQAAHAAGLSFSTPTMVERSLYLLGRFGRDLAKLRERMVNLEKQRRHAEQVAIEADERAKASSDRVTELEVLAAHQDRLVVEQRARGDAFLELFERCVVVAPASALKP